VGGEKKGEDCIWKGPFLCLEKTPGSSKTCVETPARGMLGPQIRFESEGTYVQYCFESEGTYVQYCQTSWEATMNAVAVTVV
jgi:hypothetical protein